jgi:hypothetical protein
VARRARGAAGKARGLGEARTTRSGPTERKRRCRPTTEQDQGKGVVPHRHCDRVNDPCAIAIHVRKPGTVKQSCGRNGRHADPTTAAPTPLRRAHAQTSSEAEAAGTGLRQDETGSCDAGKALTYLARSEPSLERDWQPASPATGTALARSGQNAAAHAVTAKPDLVAETITCTLFRARLKPNLSRPGLNQFTELKRAYTITKGSNNHRQR